MQTMTEIESSWTVMRSLLSTQSDVDYDRAVNWLNNLLDEVGTNEAHRLYDMRETLGTLFHAYETAYFELTDVSGVEALAYLMAEHDVSQSDLPEVGSRGVVSEILSGKRQLNARQIRALAERFGVSASVFV